MRFCLTLIIILICFQFANAQDQETGLLINDSVLYEKVYLHIDRELYSPREIVWFRLYIVSGFDHRPIKGFKNAYVELIDSAGSVVDDRLILTHNGAGIGEFILPYYIDEGFYTIRAYTKYQKNFNDRTFFYKRISIASIDRSKQKLDTLTKRKIDIGFFPESGNLIKNTINTVAVKATDNSGRGIKTDGYVVNDLGDTLADFSTTYLGISKISITDQEDIIKAERIYFIQNDFESYLSIETDKKIYHNREQVKVRLSTQLPEGDSLDGGASIAVVNRNYLLKNGYDMNCRSFLLLDSELKGPVESSASYFVDDTLTSVEKLNLLTMVQGWRSYYWNDILNTDVAHQEYWEDFGLSISGWLKHEYKPEVISNGSVTIGPFSNQFIMLNTITNSNGRYRFEHLYLRDSTNLIIQSLNHKGKPKLEIITDQTFQPDKKIDISKVEPLLLDIEIPHNFFAASFIKVNAEYDFGKKTNEVWTEKAQELFDQYYAYFSGTNLIDEVNVTAKHRFKISDLFKSNYELNYGKPDTVILARNIKEKYLDVYNYFRSNPVKRLKVKGKSFTIRNGKEPLCLLNDSKMNSSSAFSGIKFTAIDKIYIYTRIVGNAPEGIVAIYTFAPPLSSTLYEEKRNKGKKKIPISGFQNPRAFYSPTYTIDNINQEIPDYRPTMYWEPFLFFNEDQAEAKFYTSDNYSDYVIIVEGISNNGRVCS